MDCLLTDCAELPRGPLPADDSCGRALAPACRAHMESRFGADLGRVRVHTGPWAAAACRALSARAFTWGTDIAFAARQFAPETPAGRRLLAHELVHVIQQTQGGFSPRGGPWSIGRPRSRLETEADAVAEEVLGSGPLSPITPDPSRSLRRQISIDFGSAAMTLDHSGAIPALSAGKRLAGVHLTKGYLGPDSPWPHVQTADPDQFAIRFDATVELFVDTPTEKDLVLNNWEFNILQVAKAHEMSVTYDGRRKSEGEVFLLLTHGPAWPDSLRILLDSGPTIFPFIGRNRGGVVASKPQGGRIRIRGRAVLGDHPNMAVPLRVRNSVTKSPNFLQQVIDDTEFLSVFIAQDDQGVRRPPLAHVRWRVRYDAKFKWRRNSPHGVMFPRGLEVDPVVLGGPTDAAFQATVSNPAPPNINEISNAAGRQATTSANRFNRQEEPTWGLLVPPDFFT